MPDYTLEFNGQSYTITADHELSQSELTRYAAMVRTGQFGKPKSPAPLATRPNLYSEPAGPPNPAVTKRLQEFEDLLKPPKGAKPWLAGEDETPPEYAKLAANRALREKYGAKTVKDYQRMADEIAADAATNLQPIARALAEYSPTTSFMPKDVKERTANLAAGVGGSIATSPFNLAAEMGIVTSGDATLLQRTGALANIALTFLPVEEFAIGAGTKAVKGVWNASKEAKLAAELAKKADIPLEQAKQAVKEAKKFVDGQIAPPGSGPRTQAAPKAEAPAKPKVPTKTTNEGGFTTARRKTPTEQELEDEAFDDVWRYQYQDYKKNRPKGGYVHPTDESRWEMYQQMAAKDPRKGEPFGPRKEYKPGPEPVVTSVPETPVKPKADVPEVDMGFKPKETTNASQIESPTQVYGDVRTRQGEAGNEMPAQVGSQGVRQDQGKGTPAARAKEEVAPRTTGLANQVQAKETEILGTIEATKGKSASELQAIGKKMVDDNPTLDYEGMAERIARGEETLTGEKVGVLLEGKRQLINDVNKAKAKLDKSPGDRELIDAYEASKERLSTYAKNVQAGKGEWSNVGRALQAGTELETGNFAAVLEEARRGGKVSKALEKQLEATTKQVADRDARIAALEAELASERTTSTVASARPRRAFDRASVRKELDDIVAEFKALKGAPGVKQGKTRGAVSKFTVEDLKVAGKQAELAIRYVKAQVKLHVGAPLEDVVKAVQKAFVRDLGMEIDRQAVIDAIGHKAERRTRTEIQQQIAELTAEARKQTSEAIARNAKRAKALAEVKQVRLRERELARKAQEAQRMADAATQAAEKAQKRRVAENLKAAERQAKLVAAEKEKIARREFGEQWNYAERVLKTEEKVADLKAQVTEGRFRVETKREIQLSKELEDLQAERRMWSNRVQQAINANTNPPGTLRKVAGLVRGTILGSDLGVITRQGLFSAARPAAFLKGLGSAGKSMFSPKNFAKWEMQLAEKKVNGRLVAPIRQKAGLSLTNTLTQPEELSAALLIKKVFGERVGGALERFQHAFINTVRADIFDKAVAAGFSPEELKLRAQFINNATGRGNIKQVPALLEVVMTSPRYEASRWAMLGELLKNSGAIIADLAKGKVNRAALANIQDMAITAGGIYSLFKLAELAGYEVNYDPKSADFLKMRKGEEVWDVSAGIAPRLKDAIKVALILRDPGYKQSVTDVAGKAAIRAVSPVFRTTGEQLSIMDQRAQGASKPKSLFSGYVNEGDAEGLAAFAPLIAQSFWKFLQEEGPEQATSAALREFVGQSVNRYPKPKTK
jgi:hypothetical protein